MTTPESVLARADAYIAASSASPTALGRAIAGDPNFIFDLRDGREPRRKTLEKVEPQLARLEAGESIDVLLAEKAGAAPPTPSEAA